MTESEIDIRLSALLAEPGPPPVPTAFADRVIALASLELAMRRSRRVALARVGRETLALFGVLASFVGLARVAPDQAVGAGEAIATGSPAMIGLVMLAAWAAASRGSAAAR